MDGKKVTLNNKHRLNEEGVSASGIRAELDGFTSANALLMKKVSRNTVQLQTPAVQHCPIGKDQYN